MIVSARRGYDSLGHFLENLAPTYGPRLYDRPNLKEFSRSNTSGPYLKYPRSMFAISCICSWRALILDHMVLDLKSWPKSQKKKKQKQKKKQKKKASTTIVSLYK